MATGSLDHTEDQRLPELGQLRQHCAETGRVEFEGILTQVRLGDQVSLQEALRKQQQVDRDGICLTSESRTTRKAASPSPRISGV
jgi:hypothetical protein